MAPTRKIIFLDFDGPLSNSRTALASGYHDEFDSIAVRGLSHFCEAAGAQIVCTSVRTRAGSQKSFRQTYELFADAGLDMRYLHPDWSCRTDDGLREGQILRWLGAHPEVDHYVVVDDGVIDMPCFVRVSDKNGILYRHFKDMAKCLDFDLGLAFNVARKHNFPGRGQFCLPFDTDDQHYNQNVMRIA